MGRNEACLGSREELKRNLKEYQAYQFLIFKYVTDRLSAWSFLLLSFLNAGFTVWLLTVQYQKIKILHLRMHLNFKTRNLADSLERF